jgi:hypothetical protein
MRFGRKSGGAVAAVVIAVATVVTAAGGLKEFVELVNAFGESPGKVVRPLFVLFGAVLIVLVLGWARIVRIPGLTRRNVIYGSCLTVAILAAGALVAQGVKAFSDHRRSASVAERYAHDLGVLSSAMTELHAADVSPLTSSRAVTDRAHAVQQAMERVSASGRASGVSAAVLQHDVRDRSHEVAQITVGDLRVFDAADDVRVVRWLRHGPSRECPLGNGMCPPWPGEDIGGIVLSDAQGDAGGLYGCELHATGTHAFRADDGSTTVVFAGSYAADGAAGGGTYADLVELTSAGMVLDAHTCPETTTAKRRHLLDDSDGYDGATADRLVFRTSLWLSKDDPFQQCHICDHLDQTAAYQWDRIDGRFRLIDRHIENTPYAWLVRFVRSYPFHDDAQVRSFVGPSVDVGLLAAFLQQANRKACTAAVNDGPRATFTCGEQQYTAVLRPIGQMWRLMQLARRAVPQPPPLSDLRSLRPKGGWPTPDPYGPLLPDVPALDPK